MSTLNLHQPNPFTAARLANMACRITATLLAICVLSYSTTLYADSERGLAIAKEAKARDIGWGDSKADMTMILRNQQGQESVRQIRIQSLEVDGDGDKSLTIFDTPRDVQGTAFLSFSHPVGADDQWLYLPALKRVKRIASRNKSGPFMGSEFSFEDLASFEVEKYTYNFLGEEVLDGVATYKLEQFPVDQYSGYTRRVVWLDKEEYRMLKTAFYDRKNALLKTLVAKDYQQYLGKYWRPSIMDMENHQNGKSTRLEWQNYSFNNGLSDQDFNQNTLKRAR